MLDLIPEHQKQAAVVLEFLHIQLTDEILSGLSLPVEAIQIHKYLLDESGKPEVIRDLKRERQALEQLKNIVMPIVEQRQAEIAAVKQREQQRKQLDAELHNGIDKVFLSYYEQLEALAEEYCQKSGIKLEGGYIAVDYLPKLHSVYLAQYKRTLDRIAEQNKRIEENKRLEAENKRAERVAEQNKSIEEA